MSTGKYAPKADWDSVDWKQSNVEIARQVGVSRERVRQKRAELGLPPKSTIPSTEDLLRKMDVTGRTTRDLALELGVTRETISLLATKLNLTLEPITEKAKAHDWDSVDWNKPNRVIARRLGTSANVVKNRRLAMRKRGEGIPPSPR